MSPCLVDRCVEGVGVNWRPLIEFVVSVGYGVLSSVIPISTARSTSWRLRSVVSPMKSRQRSAAPSDRPSARSASYWLSVGAVVPVRCNGYGSDASAPASRPVAFEPGSGLGRTGFWNSLVITGGEYPLFSSPPASLFRRCAQ